LGSYTVSGSGTHCKWVALGLYHQNWWGDLIYNLNEIFKTI